jgi:hypothetical protein
LGCVPAVSEHGAPGVVWQVVQLPGPVPHELHWQFPAARLAGTEPGWPGAVGAWGSGCSRELVGVSWAVRWTCDVYGEFAAGLVAAALTAVGTAGCTDPMGIGVGSAGVRATGAAGAGAGAGLTGAVTTGAAGVSAGLTGLVAAGAWAVAAGGGFTGLPTTVAFGGGTGVPSGGVGLWPQWKMRVATARTRAPAAPGAAAGPVSTMVRISPLETAWTW